MISVDTLPDDVLLGIFDQYVNDAVQFFPERERAWQSLVRVCRRWRSVIFGSPRHLNLQLVCQERTPTRDMLDIWPALPLNIWCYGARHYQIGSVDNIIAVLERSDHVCRIILPHVSNSDMEILLAAMQRPFPKLTDLLLYSHGETMPVVPDSFLGGSAPLLETLQLLHIPFPGLPKLLLFAAHLVKLHIVYIPHSGYITPNAMVSALSALTSLKHLSLEFQSPRSCPDQASRHFPPSTRYVLPILKSFRFKGVTEYLEDLVARIDAPRLNNLFLTFFNDIIFDAPQFMRFISRTPTLRALEKANLIFWNRNAGLHFSSQTSGDGNVNVEILCQGLDWQLSSLEQVCTSCLPPLYMSEDLYIYEGRDSQPDWKDDITPVYCREESLPIRAICTTYRACPARAR